MGYITKTLQEIKTNMIFNIISNVDEINDANIGSILDIFVTSIAQEIEEQYDDLVIIDEGSRISTATGDYLEELGLLVGITRNTGTKATGTVSFIRNDPASSNFTIASGTIVSTQPTPGDTQYNFVTSADYTFTTTIINESHTYIDGIYDYPADQKFINSVSSIDGTAGAVAYNFIDATDYDLISDFSGNVENLTDFVLLDNCETHADWVHTDDAAAPTLNNTTYREGAGSLNLIKTSTTGKIMTYTFTAGAATDFSENDDVIWLYIKDATALGKIDTVELAITDATIATHNYEMSYDVSDLAVGWNLIFIDYTNSEVITTGNPDIVNIDIHRLRVNVNNNADTIAAGDIIIDNLHMADVYNYTGNLIRFDPTGTLPDASTAFLIDYIPLSLEVAVTADTVGADYNVGIGQVTYKVTNIAQIDTLYNYAAFASGVNIETDAELKERIENASAAANVATISALEYNLKTLTFVSNATIDDLPETTATEEVKVYDNTITNYALWQKVAINDANFTIGDTSGANDYTRNTDFTLSAVTNEIQWLGATEPVHAALFYTNFNFDKLGYVNAVIVGRGGALTATQIAEAQTLMDEKKAAGIIVTVSQPTYITVAITATLTIDATYTSADVITNVKTSIDNYFATLSVGDNVLLAEIIWSIMEVSGVDNCNVSDIGGGGAADYVIASTEVAIPGTHVIS